jgi:hypothetical protein
MHVAHETLESKVFLLVDLLPNGLIAPCQTTSTFHPSAL